MIPTEDSRVLEVVVAGAERGTTLIAHNGTPMAPLLHEPFVAAATARGIRIVTYARPGYGQSTRQEGRNVADCAQDVEHIADDLGVRRFVVTGWSGGGPHALACAALVQDRVSSCATIASVAPWGAEGLDWLAGMGKENEEEFGAALAAPEQLRTYLQAAAVDLTEVTADQVAAALGDLIPDVDRAALTGEFAEYFARSLRGAVSNGIWGWFDDDIAFTRDWGFDLSEVRVPVTIWQGDQDRMVPFAHGRWLADRVAGAKARLESGHGHLSVAVGSYGEILDDVLSQEA